MNIRKSVSLREFNTFGMDKSASHLVQVATPEQVVEALEYAKKKNLPVFVLGGGSNILLTRDLDALVIKMEIKGLDVLKETNDHIWVRVGAGEIWNDFVEKAISSNWAGIENLSLIPGTVGASPMQNIGAYGVEIEEVFDHLEAIDRKTGETVIFDHAQCEFGYRESVFKHRIKDLYIITHVVYKLNKQPTFRLDYGAVRETLSEISNGDLSLSNVSKAIVQIRQSKLPDPAVVGNAGSFFKNPTIDLHQFEQLRELYPEMPGYTVENGVKVPAAWLLENAGWKGKTFGEIGVHPKQPLVLVNYGNGEGLAIRDLSIRIQEDIKEKFGILLQHEVNIL